MALLADNYVPAQQLLKRIFPPGLLMYLAQRRPPAAPRGFAARDSEQVTPTPGSYPVHVGRILMLHTSITSDLCTAALPMLMRSSCAVYEESCGRMKPYMYIQQFYSLTGLLEGCATEARQRGGPQRTSDVYGAAASTATEGENTSPPSLPAKRCEWPVNLAVVIFNSLSGKNHGTMLGAAPPFLLHVS